MFDVVLLDVELGRILKNGLLGLGGRTAAAQIVLTSTDFFFASAQRRMRAQESTSLAAVNQRSGSERNPLVVHR